MAQCDVPEHDFVTGTSLSDEPAGSPTNNEATMAELNETDPVPHTTELSTSASQEVPSQNEPSNTQESTNDAVQGTGKESGDPAVPQENIGEEGPSIPVITSSDTALEADKENQSHPSPIPALPAETRERSDSRSTVATQGMHRSAPLTSAVFVITALDTIAASKEARRSKELGEAVSLAQGNIKQSEQHPIDPEIIFRPLELASKTVSIPLQITALDCIGKLITYSYFAFPSSPDEPSSESQNQPPLIERAIETICDCFENEATPPEIQQQIIKSLLAAVLNDKIVVHGAGLLKAVRQIYNIFIYSKSSQNQHIAQGSLTQMDGTVYDRVRLRLDLKEARLRDAQSQRNRSESDASLDQPNDDASNEQDESPEDGQSLVSDHPVAKEPREKMTLQSFETNKDDAMAIRPHLCLSLSRNGASSVPPVFEVCCEIFWLMLRHMRVMLKVSPKMLLNKELEVFFKEIYLAILEKRNSPMFQKKYFMDILGRLSTDPRALVELYLNYDCDRMALENTFQGIIEQLSRISSMPVAVTVQQQQQYQEHRANTPTSAHDWHQPGTLPPSLSTAKIDNIAPTSSQNIPPEYAMKQRALECLVEILRSLDTWSSQDTNSSKSLPREPFSRNSLAMSRESLDTAAPTLSTASPRVDSGEPLTGQSTPVAEDDPNEIEKAKQQKIALTNAIRQFNFKPKRGMKLFLSEGFIRSKLKRKMTKEDFIRNNRDLQDVPQEYLGGIYDEIANNEIVLYSEREHAANLGQPTPAPGLASRAGQVLATVGRDIQGEKYAQASEEIANKTEQLYRSLIRAQRKSAMKEALSRFIPATSVRHVGSMFNVTWMSFLSGLSAQVQDTQNLDTIRQCMEGIRLAIRISCAFDLETPRVAFVTALAKFTNLGNLREMMAKNLEALKVLLDVAISEGNHLKSSWREILTCISQLDRFQLLTDGVDEGALPDMSVARVVPPSDSSRTRKSLQVPRRPRPRSINGSTQFRPDIAMESRSTEMVRGVDRIFTNTANLSQDAIVDFVWALSNVSWQEIQSSGQSESPRTYSLQKLVEISYYNMTRVRIEWNRIWEVLGEHFNHVGCHANTAVVFFALDSLRQLSMRFLEIEELPGFKFQKDFLKPFEHVMANSTVVTVKDMVLRCLIQMIQARGNNIRSGWKTMFGVFSVAAREPYEGIVNMAFEHVSQIYNTRFGVIITQGAFPDLVVCLTEFSKNLKFQKKSLQAIETLKSTVPKMLKTPECPLSHRRSSTSSAPSDTVVPLTPQTSRQSAEEQFWYPVLIAFQDVLMTGDDLEVRSRALTYLFEILIRYGGDFPTEFWDVLWRQLLYPIFVVLQSKSEMSKVPNHEELSVWLSTTMIQALRHMITLFTHYFDALEYMLDRFLGLLTLCICQENDTIARIGSNCLQQLILQNVQKFQATHWDKIVGAFVELFEKTTAYELFTAVIPNPAKSSESSKVADDSASVNEISNEQIAVGDETSINGDQRPATATEAEEAKSPQHSAQLEDHASPTEQQQAPLAISASRRKFFNRIITNCVLQLLMIETVNELFSNDAVYEQIPSDELLRLMALLKKSYQFAKKFNEAKDLRVALWKQGFMKQPPNLLKQESGSAATYVNILFRMYHDEGDERKSSRGETEEALIPLCADIIRGYVKLDEETQQRNIAAWRPVVVDVVEGYTGFPRETFDKHVETFYPLGVELLSRDLNSEVRLALQSLFRRVGECRLGMRPVSPVEAPMSPRGSVLHSYFGNGHRRSRGRSIKG
ncbi:transport protein sec72 [Coccidioides immitis RMSCC 3703]|uniref:Transport protein sec72 n=1 Tax=Coccidioides immitis RMSCC 3703 TaxID=454286 RepID=A0A0J8R2I1_COCIT|nr:transport protein sec72 [Coccidioides immitis RMSCC 3703]